jgi:hypothetical protein
MEERMACEKCGLHDYCICRDVQDCGGVRHGSGKRSNIVSRLSTDYAFFDREGVKWYRWNGDESIIPNGICDAFFSDGDFLFKPFPSNELHWFKDNPHSYLIAYRITEE